MDIFITGTDTNIGKTVVTAGLAGVMQSVGYSMGVYKPVQSGAENKNGFLLSPDLKFVMSVDPNIKTSCSYCFEEPVAPSLAAFLSGVRVKKENFINDFQKLRMKSDIVIVEGAGGILAPLYEKFLIADLIKLLNLPVVIVSRPDLGTINHTLLTIRTAKACGLKVMGIIINKYPYKTSDIGIKSAPKIIQELSDVDILGVLPEFNTLKGEINPEILLENIINHVDLEKVFGMKIPKLAHY